MTSPSPSPTPPIRPVSFAQAVMGAVAFVAIGLASAHCGSDDAGQTGGTDPLDGGSPPEVDSSLGTDGGLRAEDAVLAQGSCGEGSATTANDCEYGPRLRCRGCMAIGDWLGLDAPGLCQFPCRLGVGADLGADCPDGQVCSPVNLQLSGGLGTSCSGTPDFRGDYGVCSLNNGPAVGAPRCTVSTRGAHVETYPCEAVVLSTGENGATVFVYAASAPTAEPAAAVKGFLTVQLGIAPGQPVTPRTYSGTTRGGGDSIAFSRGEGIGSPSLGSWGVDRQSEYSLRVDAVGRPRHRFLEGLTATLDVTLPPSPAGPIPPPSPQPSGDLEVHVEFISIANPAAPTLDATVP